LTIKVAGLDAFTKKFEAAYFGLDKTTSAIAAPFFQYRTASRRVAYKISLRVSAPARFVFHGLAFFSGGGDGARLT
jgi:hypothetical protein